MAAIQISNVQKSYQSAGKPLQALGGVSLSIEEGEFFGLLGPNGAGKTTLISIIAGLNRADSGQVLVKGHDVVRDYRLHVANSVWCRKNWCSIPSSPYEKRCACNPVISASRITTLGSMRSWKISI